MNAVRSIVHLDMDAFYASLVEALGRSFLEGKAGRSSEGRRKGVVVSAASYEARAFGVHSALPMATAMRLCPKGVFLPVRMKRYQEISEQGIRYLPPVHSVRRTAVHRRGVSGRDGVRDTVRGRPVEIARKIKRSVLDETGLTVSAGVAPNKFLAKIASDLDKPDGLTVVKPGRGAGFFAPPAHLEALGRGQGDPKGP